MCYHQHGYQSSAQPNDDVTTSTETPPTPRPSTPIPLSRTNSTITLATDTEEPVVVGRPGRQARKQSIAGPGSSLGPSTRRPKRTRSPVSEGSDDDDEYLPRKRVKVNRSSTRSIQAVRKSSVYVIAELNSTPILLCRSVHPWSL